ISMDLRGYTQLVRGIGTTVSAKFMDEYHKAVSTVVGSRKGYIHKTAGDGHLVSFGLMDDLPDLSDLPGIEDELNEAEKNRGRHFLAKAIETVDAVVRNLSRLADQFNLEFCPKIG